MKRALFSTLCLIICAFAHTQAMNHSHHETTHHNATQSAPAKAGEAHISGSETPPHESLTLWDNSPAVNWTREALPIGNGDMGAMIFGGIAQDRIQFNHKTLWKGSSKPTDLGSYLAFGDLYIINKNTQASENYKRELDLTKAKVKVSYIQNNSAFERDYFCSYPDQVIVIRYKAIGSEKFAREQSHILKRCCNILWFSRKRDELSGKSCR